MLAHAVAVLGEGAEPPPESTEPNEKFVMSALLMDARSGCVIWPIFSSRRHLRHDLADPGGDRQRRVRVRRVGQRHGVGCGVLAGARGSGGAGHQEYCAERRDERGPADGMRGAG